MSDEAVRTTQGASSTADAPLDCLVIGGGPAGLTAAVYLARFHLSVLVVDANESRAAMIPLSHNHAGFPEGIHGPDLLQRLRTQATLYGARLRTGRVEDVKVANGGFVAATSDGPITARTVLLATGVYNRRPAMPEALHDAALARGLLRYCPICDAFEVTDKPVGLIGTGDHGMSEAMFMRSYTAVVTLIAPEGPHALDAPQRASLTEAGIALLDGPCGEFVLLDDAIAVELPGGRRQFASLYSALGTDTRGELAVRLGVDLEAEKCPAIDAEQRTSIPGFYAAGDVVNGLDQISYATGQGAVAATTIRNDLNRQRPLRR